MWTSSGSDVVLKSAWKWKLCWTPRDTTVQPAQQYRNKKKTQNKTETDFIKKTFQLANCCLSVSNVSTPVWLIAMKDLKPRDLISEWTAITLVIPTLFWIRLAFLQDQPYLVSDWLASYPFYKKKSLNVFLVLNTSIQSFSRRWHSSGLLWKRLVFLLGKLQLISHHIRTARKAEITA